VLFIKCVDGYKIRAGHLIKHVHPCAACAPTA
jgi:hypothetical protein